MDIISKIEKEQLKQDVATFNVGDTVKVHCRVVEGGKERIQIFEGLVIARYLEVNPNGSRRDIAGITNERGNVVGLMPHPEHAVEALTGPTTDGLPFFTSAIRSLLGATA